MNYSKIEVVRNNKKISQKELAQRIGMTRENYGRMIKKHSMKVEILEKIADVLQVSMSIFFEEENNNVVNEPHIPYNKVKPANDQLLEIMQELRNQLRVKDEQIAFLQHLIEEMQK